MKTPCRLCPEPATRGAYSWKNPKDPDQWLFALLCQAHGNEAVLKGCRKMSWRPKPKKDPK